MADEPQKTQIVGEVKIAAADGAKLDAGAPTAQTTTKTEKTEVLTGTPVQPPPPAVIADDSIRKWVAQESIGTNFLLLMVVLYLMFFHSAQIPKDALPFVTGIIGAIVGSSRADVTTCINYLFGSSSGSTAKSAVLDKK